MLRLNCMYTTSYTITVAGAILALILLAGCGQKADPPVPTHTPAPTFTPTVAQATLEPGAAATLKTQQEAVAAQPATGEQPAGEQPAAAPPVDTPIPADTPTVAPTSVPAAEVVVNSSANVRNGPGTEYNILGSANAGQRFPVKGRNDASTWWQIDFQGQDGWIFGELVTAQNTQAVAVAVNIPAPPPPTATAIPQPQPAPQQPAPEQPTPAPAPPQASYEFNKAILQRCDPNEGVTYVQGTTYKGGQPTSGYLVAFSYAPDGPIVATVQSGPHQGYEGWSTGFYSHILSPNSPREGDWSFWIVDSSGKRISQIANVHTDGSAGDGKCQQAIIDFDS